MASLKSFFKALIGVLGIFSFYGYIFLAIIQSLFFVFTIIVGFSYYSYVIWLVPFMPIEMNLEFFWIVFLEFWKFLGFGLIWGVIGIIYLIKNQKRYKQILSNKESPTNIELKNSLFYAIFSIIILVFNIIINLFLV